KGNNLQVKGLIEKGIEVTAFVLGAARLCLRKDVVRLQAQAHKWVAETWRALKHQVTEHGNTAQGTKSREYPVRLW
ncbi:hypothetical protein GOODEAATRI_005758, partial [Goodea atripinnis]